MNTSSSGEGMQIRSTGKPKQPSKAAHGKGQRDIKQPLLNMLQKISYIDTSGQILRMNGTPLTKKTETSDSSQLDLSKSKFSSIKAENHRPEAHLDFARQYKRVFQGCLTDSKNSIKSLFNPAERKIETDIKKMCLARTDLFMRTMPIKDEPLKNEMVSSERNMKYFKGMLSIDNNKRPKSGAPDKLFGRVQSYASATKVGNRSGVSGMKSADHSFSKFLDRQPSISKKGFGAALSKRTDLSISSQADRASIDNSRFDLKEKTSAPLKFGGSTVKSLVKDSKTNKPLYTFSNHFSKKLGSNKVTVTGDQVSLLKKSETKLGSRKASPEVKITQFTSKIGFHAPLKTSIPSYTAPGALLSSPKSKPQSLLTHAIIEKHTKEGSHPSSATTIEKSKPADTQSNKSPMNLGASENRALRILKHRIEKPAAKEVPSKKNSLIEMLDNGIQNRKKMFANERLHRSIHGEVDETIIPRWPSPKPENRAPKASRSTSKRRSRSKMFSKKSDIDQVKLKPDA